MATPPIGELIESLAQAIQRSVTVDDADLNLINYSSHFEEADPARMSALLARATSGTAREYLMRHDVQHWRRPQVLEACPEIGFVHQRIGFPIWSEFSYLGCMWIIVDRPLSGDEMQACTQVVDDLVDLLETRLVARASSIGELPALRSLIDQGSSPEARSEAVAALSASLGDQASYLPIVIRPLAQPEATLAVVGQALSRAATLRHRGSVSFAITADHAVVVISVPTSTARRQFESDSITQQIRAAVARDKASKIVMGVGTPATVGEIVTSLARASAAARIAERRGLPIAEWDEYPLDAMLDALRGDSLRPELLPRQLAEAMAAQPAEMLHFLEAFLDSGANVHQTANALHMHRTTIYYRLQRFADSTSLDLDDGVVRLMVHLWLKTMPR